MSSTSLERQVFVVQYQGQRLWPLFHCPKHEESDELIEGRNPEMEQIAVLTHWAGLISAAQVSLATGGPYVDMATKMNVRIVARV